MTTKKLMFIAFKPQNEHFIGFLSMEAVANEKINPEILLDKAVMIYEKYIKRLRFLIEEISKERTKHIPIKARKIWNVGNAIFELIRGLEILALEVDNLYEHLVRDLKVKRKWLEKVIIFRRYIPNEKLIPNSLNWGRCEKGTRKKAMMIASGQAF